MATRHTVDGQSRPGRRADKHRRARVIQMATTPPDRVLGCAADVWGSREAPPQRPAWRDDTPVHLGDKTVPAKAPERNALACEGRSVPTAHHMRWRWVRGRPGSAVTWAVLAGLARDLTAQGTRALVRIWDQAAWHLSQTGQEGLHAHHRHATHEGGWRLLVCRRPTQSPWLNPIAPKWVHGTRAVVAPTRVLSMAERIPRVWADDPCDLTDPMAQPDC